MFFTWFSISRRVDHFKVNFYFSTALSHVSFKINRSTNCSQTLSLIIYYFLVEYFILMIFPLHLGKMGKAIILAQESR